MLKVNFISLYFILSSFLVYSQDNGENKSIKEKKVEAILFDKLNLPASILVWYDKFNDEHSIKPCGTYNVKKYGLTRKLNIDKPTLFVLPIGNQIPFLVNPSDTIDFYTVNKISVFADKGTPTLKHQSRILRTNELKFFEEVFDSLGACFGMLSYSTPKQIITIREALKYHVVRLERRNQFLNQRYRVGKIGHEFYYFAKKYFHYKFYDDVFSSFQSKRFPDSLTKKLALKLADSLITEINNDGSNYYSWFDALKNYVKLKLGFNNNTDSNSFDKLLDDISINLSGESKDFAIFYLYKFLLDKKADLVKTKMNLLQKYCSDKEYVSYISGNTIFTKTSLKEKISEKVLEYNGISKNLTSVINNHKNKVIYIDFWASWCLPCLEEIPFSKNLIEEFKNTDVVFLFLSTDTYSDRWKKSIKENEMAAYGVHYLILDGENNYFIKKYNIGPIPRYILINKKGEVVNPDAPRPSEEKIKELILESLKQ